MKTNWQKLYILWSALVLGLSCAADTDVSQYTRRKKSFKLSTPKSKLTKLSTGVGTPGHGLPVSSVRTGKPEANIQSDFAHLPDVSVTCSVSDLVVRVKPSFYGLGADAEELKLGSSCKSNGALGPYGDLLFTYPLTACDAVRELPPGYLIYKFVLHYESSQKRFPGRTHRIDVDIECRYQRDHHVYQLAVKPTWQTAVMRKRLKGRSIECQISLMDESWSEPVKSQMYLLGNMVNFQVSASHLPKRGKLYINNCYAAPSSGNKSSLKYTIIDNMGCMIDSKLDPDASQFISRTNRTLRFSLKAFQFTADPDTEINIHCKLSVTSGDPDPAHKSCTYKGNRWQALTGEDSICECCDSLCVTSKRRRAVFEGSASIGLLVSDQSYTAEDVSRSTEDENRTSPRAEMHGWENLQESTDVAKDDGKEEQGYVEEKADENEDGKVTLGEINEPGLDKLDWKHEVFLGEWDDTGVGSDEFRENGQGELGGFIEGEEQKSGSQGRETEQGIHLNPKGDVTHHWAQVAQLQPGTRGELENTKYTVKSEEGERRRVSEGESDEEDDLADGEKTWYFTWR